MVCIVIVAIVGLGLAFSAAAKVPYPPGVPATSLVASPSVLTVGQGENIKISWDIEFESKDWIGIYSPSTSRDNDYFDYVWVNESWSGSFTYFVINMRTDYEFRYWRSNSSTYYIPAATSNVVTFELGPNQPLQGHISITENLDEMHVMWVSNSTTTPQVEYGTTSGKYPLQTAGSSSTYSSDMMCGAPANVTSAQAFRPPGFQHTVLLSGLAPSTVYYYRFGNPEDGFSPEYSFQSRGPSTNGMKFLVYGDMGTYDYRCGCSGAAATAAKIADDVMQEGYGYDFAMHIGDISYAEGKSYMWDQFFTIIEPIATRTPYLIGIGNHDYVHDTPGRDPSGQNGTGFHPSWGNYNDDSAGECGVPTYYRFRMPDTTAHNKMSPFWYSYDYDLAHFVMMSTEHNFTTGSPQYEWLQNDLQTAAQNRENVPWIIFFGHRPMYESEDYPSDSRVSAELRGYLEDLLYEYKVNLALWGHYHSYQRTCPVYNQECVGDNATPGATVHVTVGSAGADLDNANYLPVNWTIYSTYAYGYTRISIANESLLTLEFVGTYGNGTTDILDSFSLSQWN